MSNRESEAQENSEQQEEQEVGEFLDELPAEFKELPPEIKRVVQSTLSMQRVSTPFVSPIQQKINEGHISKILEIVEKDDERTFADAQSSKKYTLAYVIIFSLLFVFATVFLTNKNEELYKEVLKFFIVFLGGLGSGFGLGKYGGKKDD